MTAAGLPAGWVKVADANPLVISNAVEEAINPYGNAASCNSIVILSQKEIFGYEDIFK